MIPGNASSAFIPNFPNRDAKALSFDLTHSSRPFSSLGGGWPPPPDAVVAQPPGNNASTSTQDGHSDSCEYRSNSNSLLSKQSSNLFS